MFQPHLPDDDVGFFNDFTHAGIVSHIKGHSLNIRTATNVTLTLRKIVAGCVNI